MPFSNQRILLVDDHPLILDSTSQLLAGILPGAEISTASSQAEMKKLALQFEFHAVISDLLVGDTTPQDQIDTTLELFARAKIVFLSGLELCSELKESIPNDRAIFISKSSSYLEMTTRLRDLIKTDNQLDLEPTNEFRSMVQVPGQKPLTHKQVAIMDGIVDGKTNKEIAKELNLSPDTVRAHVKEAYTRLDSANRATAVSAYLAAKRLSVALHGS